MRVGVQQNDAALTAAEPGAGHYAVAVNLSGWPRHVCMETDAGSYRSTFVKL